MSEDSSTAADIPAWKPGDIAEYDARQGVPPRIPVPAMLIKVAEGRVKIRYIPPDSQHSDPIVKWVHINYIRPVVSEALGDSIQVEEETEGEQRSSAFLDHIRVINQSQVDLIVEMHLLGEDYELTQTEIIQILVLMMHSQALRIIIEGKYLVSSGRMIKVAADPSTLDTHQNDMLHVQLTLEVLLERLSKENQITPAECMHMLIFALHMQTALLLAGEDNAAQAAQTDDSIIIR